MSVSQAAIRVVCDKCGVEAMSTPGSLGKYHQACGSRKKGGGEPRKASGKWVGK